MNDMVYDIVLKGVEDTSQFTPEILVYLIGFMLMLEFFGGIFLYFHKFAKVGGK